MIVIYDLILKNVRIIDGTGNPWFKGELAVHNDKIVKISRKITGQAVDIIDVQGKYITPGFIDPHTHSDFVFFIDSRAQGKIRQGITTEVVGNCGLSAAPYQGQVADQVAAIRYGYTPDWKTVSQYFKALTNQPKPVNIAPLVGHGTLRTAVIGLSDRKPTSGEEETMAEILETALAEGAFGLSLGLYYIPGSFASQWELIKLAKVVAEHGAVLTCHLRDEGKRTVGFITSVREIIKVASAAGVSLQISHIKAFGPDVWGSSTEILAMTEKARNGGLDVTFDQYPYTATGGFIYNDTLPVSFQNGKSISQIQVELQEPEIRNNLEAKIANNIRKRAGAENQIIANFPVNQALEGLTLQEISVQKGKTPAQTVMDLLIEFYEASWISKALNPDDVNRFMQYPGTMICSDGASLSLKGTLSEGHPHPRNFAAFPHVLKDYVQKQGILTLEEAVRKMTSLPAIKFRIKNRGLIAEGYQADLLVFDPTEIKDITFTEQAKLAEGISSVMVNGKWVIKDNDFTGVLPGRLLRKLN